MPDSGSMFPAKDGANMRAFEFASGPGYLNTSQRKLRCKQIIAESGADSEALCREARGAHLGTTFGEQSERWLKRGASP